MKRKSVTLLLILIIGAMLLSLSACGDDNSEFQDLVTPGPEDYAEITGRSLPEESPAAEEAVPAETEEAAESPEPAAEDENAWIEELRASLPPLPDIDIHSWEFLLANSYNSISEYELAQYSNLEGQGIDSRILPAASDFIHAGRDAGYQLYNAASYRNFEYLLNHYMDYVRSEGSAYEASKLFLGPGCSDHQTGLAIDLTHDPKYNLYYNEFSNAEFLDTEVYQWALQHCAEYGFINRYPEGKEEFYGVACHSAGHFRYVGVEAATYIMENNLCLEEFIALYDPSLVFIPSKIVK